MIALSRQGDETACAELLERYQKIVYTMAVCLLQDREECREVAQDVFLEV